MAEGGAPESITELLQCVICSETLKHPVIFPCLHHFCKHCHEEHYSNSYEEQDGIQGVNCPICRQFAGRDHIKDDFVMEEIVSVHLKKSQNKNKREMCEICEVEDSQCEFKCLECKCKMCKICEKGHLKIPSCKGHTIKELKDIEDIPVVNTVQFCSDHQNKILEYNCQVCSKPVCITCMVITHNGHQGEEIDKAIEKLMPVVKQKLKPVENDVNVLTYRIGDLDRLNNVTQNLREKLKSEIDKKTKNLQQKLQHDSDCLKSEVDEICDRQTRVIEYHQSWAKNNLASKKSVESWFDTLTTNLQDVDLLLQLQGNITTTLDRHKQELCDDQIPVINPLMKDVQYVTYEPNMVGTLKDKGLTITPMHEVMNQLRLQNEELKTNLDAERKKYKQYTTIINNHLGETTVKTPRVVVDDIENSLDKSLQLKDCTQW